MSELNSRVETLLNDMIDDDPPSITPRSRVEQILTDLINSGSSEVKARSRVEALLKELDVGGGSTNVLSGASAPTAAQGSNGTIYLQYLGVPSEYSPLEYIQSDGNQYIDIGYIPTTDTSAELKLNAQNIQESAILGSAWAMNGFFLMFYNSRFRWHSGSSGDSSPISLNTDYIVKVSNTRLMVDDTQYGVSAGYVMQQPVRLFSTTVAGDPGANGVKGSYKLYYCQIYENDDVAMALVPVKRNSDGELGLYDVVGGNFYINGGTGNFSAGSEIGRSIIYTYAKVNGVWQPLIGTNINDIDLSNSQEVNS